jgi:hypothetical protein
MYLYGFSPISPSIETTLDTMNETTSQLYFIIKNQMQENDHPLFEVTQAFINYYLDHYTNQIMQSKGREDFYLLTEVQQDFQITYMDNSEKRVLENYQMESDDTS